MLPDCTRALASAEVQAAAPFKRAISPSVLAQIGRDLIRAGESFFLIQVRDGQLKLLPQSSTTVLGDSADESGWSYICSEYGPSASKTRTASAQQMIHVRYAVDRFRPWQGIPPWSWGRTTAAGLSGIENMIAKEAGAPFGTLLSLPESPQTDAAGNVRPLDALRNDLNKARGRTLLLETPSAWTSQAGAGAGRAADQTEFGLSRELLDILKKSSAVDILAACGCPASLFNPISDGTSKRESYRQWFYGSLVPVSLLIAQELTAKLETPISFDLSGLAASDTQGRSRSFKALRDSGLSKKAAAKNAGIIL